MKSRSIYKVPQGKLLKIALDYDQETNMITNVCITGDFFAYPEEALEQLEEKLKHTYLERAELQKKISSIISEYHIEFIGLNAEALTQGILMCVS